MDCVIFISLDGDLWCEERWLQQCWDSEIVWEWECCIVNLIIILLWRNIRELVSSAVQASDQSVDHVWPSFAGPSWDETEPARIDNEPGVATAECRANSWYITHCRHQTLAPGLQCCTQLLQITLHTHITEPTLQHRVRRVHRGLLSFRRQLAIRAEMWGGCLFYFRDQTESRSWADICPEPLTSPPVTVVSSLSLLHHHIIIIIITLIIILDWGSLSLSSSFHSHSLTDGHQQACNYKIGSQDDRKSSTNQNLDRSFKGKAGFK